MYNVFSRAQSRAIGIEPALLQSSLACCLIRVARGIYAVAADCSHPAHARLRYFLEDPALFLARSRGAAPDRARPHPGTLSRWERDRLDHVGWLACTGRIAPGDIVSHRSAAMVHDLPLLPGRLTRLEVSSPHGRITTPGLRRRERVIADEDIVEAHPIGSLRVTSRARTVVDLIRDCGTETGIMAAECFLGRPGTDEHGRPGRFPLPAAVRQRRKAVLCDAAGRLLDGWGAARLRRVLDLGTGLSESPAEALALLGFHSVSIGDVVQQAELYTDQGAFIGRVDFLLERLGLVIEVDGESKYRASGTILMDRRALLREKRRENAIRALGFRVLRLEWADVIDPQRFVAALRSVGALR